MSSSGFNEEYRFGSAAWADEYALGAAGLFTAKGPQIGYFGKRALHLESDAPMLTIGGAGSGKLRDIIGYVVCNSPGQRMIALDPRGELSAISFHVHAQNGEYAYFWNPFGLHGLPQHGCNPLDLLKADSPNFHADSKFVARALVPVSGAAEGKYFEQRASGWVEALIKADVEGNGQTSLPRLAAIVNLIESGNPLWADILEAMIASCFDDVRRTAGEMLVKQQDAPREFGSIMGEIYASLGFLDDPVLQRHLQSSDFSLEALCHPMRACKIILIVPAEYLKQLAPVLRLMFTGTMLYKSRAPGAKRVMMLVDEAGQLGSFDALLQAFTYGRGAGIRPWAFFQDAGQITRHYGAPGLQGFMGSAQLRQFFGVRDYQTAQLVANMLGSETLEYDDPRQQEAAKNMKRQALQRVMNGEDAFAAMIDAAHHSRAAQIRTKQARKLMTEEEILSLPEDRQILFISGKNLKPVFAHKYPYFTRREMAGRYLPNPYHPPSDRVAIASWRGRRWLRVIREGVPEAFAAFPQYRDGEWAYLEGYKPR
ncbi:type IV secretory system conjugative DNA transfer family protein [Methyloceanibacter sp.]|uniref:type IV secretory system conjugative DNA transfer family protein n=1 Tax=Methyloceanibacter sp. TaxID=1965321 RepID=UPI002C6F2FF2|nr:type IV secretory system conjugative DNA transfer family protein [Methyloceanibacter sp.]HML91228.1 type IV secretory system conjugative DNA transfer family protein [Methyloceanibacter sp.]